MLQQARVPVKERVSEGEGHLLEGKRGLDEVLDGLCLHCLLTQWAVQEAVV
jgi:hypothetical protein